MTLECPVNIVLLYTVLRRFLELAINKTISVNDKCEHGFRYSRKHFDGTNVFLVLCLSSVTSLLPCSILIFWWTNSDHHIAHRGNCFSLLSPEGVMLLNDGIHHTPSSTNMSRFNGGMLHHSDLCNHLI
jgi:hypothetical protein